MRFLFLAALLSLLQSTHILATDSSTSSVNRRATDEFYEDELEDLSNNWLREPYPHMYDSDACNIDIVTTDITLEEFNKNYFYKKPLLIVPTESYAQHHRSTRHKWARKEFIRRYGNLPVALGTLHSLTVYGAGKIDIPLEEYLKQLRNETSIIKDKYYLFDRSSFFQTAADMLTEYKKHPIFDLNNNPAYETATTLALGPTKSGINFHFHKDGWNEVLFGRKRWFFYPPSITPPNGYNSHEPVYKWYDENYATLVANKSDAHRHPIECFQYPGEIMYVPEGWFHSTINIGETIAVAGQSALPGTNTVEDYVHGITVANNSKDLFDNFHKALELAPTHHQIWEYAGNFHRDRGLHNESIPYFAKSLELNPLCPISARMLARAYHHIKDYDKAYEYYKLAAKLNDDFESHESAGNMAEYFDKPDEALEHYEKAAALSHLEWREHNMPPDFHGERQEVYVAACAIYIEQQKYEDCIRIANERHLHFNPIENQLMTQLITSYRNIGEITLADKLQQLEDYYKKMDEMNRWRQYQQQMREGGRPRTPPPGAAPAADELAEREVQPDEDHRPYAAEKLGKPEKSSSASETHAEEAVVA